MRRAPPAVYTSTAGGGVWYVTRFTALHQRPCDSACDQGFSPERSFCSGTYPLHWDRRGAGPRTHPREGDLILYNRGRTPLRVDGDVTVVRGDRTDGARFADQLAALGTLDCVVDMVCFDPAEAESAIRACRGRVGQYIFCSSVTVYDKAGAGYPFTEQAPRDHPLGDYAAKKARCEDIFLAAHRRGDLPVTILRPGSTYAEGQGIIHTFGGATTYIDRLRRGKPIIVLGDGQSLWVACHADDVARGFVGALGNQATLGRAYNVTGEEWMTWDRYHRTVAAAVGAPEPTLVHIPTDLLAAIAPERARLAALDLRYTNIFDTTAARRDLGFRYTIPWADGARRVVAWLDAHGGIANSDADPFDDRVVAAWEALTVQMAARCADVAGVS